MKEHELKEGDRVSFEYRGKLLHGTITENINGLCLEYLDGSARVYTTPLRHALEFPDEFANLKLIEPQEEAEEPTSDNPYKYGDVIISPIGKRLEVSAVLDDMVFLCIEGDYLDEAVGAPRHYRELNKLGYKRYTEEKPETTTKATYDTEITTYDVGKDINLDFSEDV